MKLRIKGNSVRIRLTRSEIDHFGAEDYLEEHTEFGDSNFTYALQRKPGATELSAGFAGNKMTVFVPETIVAEWTTTDKVGYEHNMDTGKGTLFILIEKDFKCIDNTTEDQSDNYENPLSACG